MRALNSRMFLSEKDKQYYLGLEKGYEGEVEFDRLVRGSFDGWLFVNDLLLEHNKTFFQIDSLGICGDELYLFDPKNFEGDFVVNGDRWQTTAGKEIKNPLHQLNRCESLLRRFLQERGLPVSIKPYLIFINPTFTLYQAPQNPSFIFPTQLNSFINNLKRIPSNPSSKGTRIAKLLMDAHIEDYPNPFIPSYEYSDLRKGIVCSKCRAFMDASSKQRRMICGECSYREALESAVMRSVAEFQLLFPEKKVSTVEIFEWCGRIWCKKTIQRVLMRNLTCMRHNKATYYIRS